MTRHDDVLWGWRCLVVLLCLGLSGRPATAQSLVRLPLLNEITSLDPADATSAEAVELTSQLFTGLVKLDPKTLRPVPALAERWTVSEDGLTYTVMLRDGLQWSNGTPITAADAVATLRRNVTRALTPGALAGYRALAGGEAVINRRSRPETLGVRAVDARTLEMHLARPAPWFPVTLALPALFPLPEAAFKGWSEGGITLENQIVSGPYLLSRIRKENFYNLVRNPHYFMAGAVAIDAISYVYIRRPEIIPELYLGHWLDAVGHRYDLIGPSDLIRIRNEAKLSEAFSVSPGVGITGLLFNPGLALVNQVEVRKSLAAIIDRTEIVRRVGGRVATRLLAPELAGSRALAPMALIDAATAGRQLADLGFSDAQTRPELIIGTPPALEPVAQVLRSTLMEALNLDVRVVVIKDSDLQVQALAQGKVHALVVHWEPAYADSHALLGDRFNPELARRTWPTWNEPKFSARFAAALERSEQQRDETARVAAFAEAERLLIDEYGLFSPLLWDSYPALVNPTIDATLVSLGGQPLELWHPHKSASP